MPRETTDSPESSEPPSSWSRLPRGDEGEGRDRPAGRKKGEALAEGLRVGLTKASQLIEAGREEFERLIGSADLPEIGTGDPIQALAVRLDREADLWRALAFGELARVAWVDKVVQAVSVFAFLGTLALAFVGWAGAMLGPSDSGSRALLVTAGVVALGVGAGLVAWIGGTVRASRYRVAREALARADLTELRLHRVAVVLALREDDEDTFKAALVRLESDTATPPR